MPRMWLTLRLCARAKADKVHFILEWSGRVPLDVETNTVADVFKVVGKKKLRHAGMNQP